MRKEVDDTAIIRLENVGKSFGRHQVLSGVNLCVPRGASLAIRGASGSGKTTLMNIMAGIEKPSGGTVTVCGTANPALTPKREEELLRRHLTLLFQNFALVDEQSVEANLKVALYYVKGRDKEKREKMRQALRHVGLDGFLERKIYELSGGEQQRVAIARAILKPSELLLADEPTGSLDAKNAEQIMALLLELNRQGKTLVIVTHDAYVASCCRMSCAIREQTLVLQRP